MIPAPTNWNTLHGKVRIRMSKLTTQEAAYLWWLQEEADAAKVLRTSLDGEQYILRGSAPASLRLKRYDSRREALLALDQWRKGKE